jgi:hypothetical protein
MPTSTKSGKPSKNKLRPDGRPFDFYCEQLNCWMMFRACLLRRKMRETLNINLHGTGGIPTILACYDCPQGDCIEKEFAQAAALATMAQRQNPESIFWESSGETVPIPLGEKCLWPGCQNPRIAHGICHTHYKQVQRDRLISCTTRGLDNRQVRALVVGISDICAATKQAPEVVVLHLIAEGIQQYRGMDRGQGA